ncbi:MAG: helix-turn-helix domain-containing protein [Bacteroidetes bacterium]|nr:helix-turn-helix domain-containing protein [Bacteroidota bacterium]
MNKSDIKACYIGPEISPEQFISEHFFLFLIKGKMEGYDGHKHYTLHPGECCIVRKNHLARYNKQKVGDEFEKVVLIFDEVFLKKFQERHEVAPSDFSSNDAFFLVKKNELVLKFLQSLAPYYDGKGKMDQTFSDLKREELLLILLKSQPELSNILFDFGQPGKIDLEAFMNQHYKFNVSNQRLAFMTGRSLSAFKRDFEKTFHLSPNRWLVKKRLEEAYFLLEKHQQKPIDIYLDLGFEDLSHFSFAFKKHFGFTPSEVSNSGKVEAF